MALLTKILFGVFSVVIAYISYVFTIKGPATDFSTALATLCQDQNFISILMYSGGLVLGVFFLSLLVPQEGPQKYFTQKISVQEYERQKKTYTQIKLNELSKSEEYKKYIESKNIIK